MIKRIMANYNIKNYPTKMNNELLNSLNRHSNVRLSFKSYHIHIIIKWALYKKFFCINTSVILKRIKIFHQLTVFQSSLLDQQSSS